MSRRTRIAPALLAVSALALISGCSSVGPIATSTASPSLAIRGTVHGGQQPVAGATIQLYSVGTTGDGSSASALGTSTTTASDGSFSLTGKYNCTNATNGVNTLVYLVSTGGNPGSGANANLVMMAALGQCSSLTESTFIYIDEVTTVGSVAALYSPYMTSATNLGSASGDAATFATAFGNVAQYTNTSTGTAPGPSLPGGMYASSTEINTLSNIVAACVNSTGGAAVGSNSSDGSACGNLFNLTRSGGVAPTNTIQALINILNNPTQNASALFSLPQPIVPFQPSLSTAPTTWALPILPIAATPTFSVAGGTYSSAQFVTLSDTSGGAVIHYTLDGSTPTSTSATYSSTITVSSSETIKAIAIGGGFASSAVASSAYTMTGSTATYTLNGQIILANCGGTIPPITVTLFHSGVVVQTTTTNGSGNFTFSGVPNSSYVVAPSITGPSAVFYPSVRTPTINGGGITIPPISANLGYTVSGTVAYAGSQTGQIYLALNSTNCGGGGSVGTSISSKGAYTIRGVAPGTYTLRASTDNLASGNPNGSNPVGSSPVTLTSANLTNQNVTLSDPATVTITAPPSIEGASGFNSGAVVQFKPITSGGVETPTSYTLQWSTDPAFGTITGSKTFVANGTKANAWFFTGLADGSILYFRASGSSAGTAVGPYSSNYGPVTIGAPTGGNTISGAVSFTGVATGPMYIGFLSQTNGSFYSQYVPSPTSAQAYTIQVPSDTYHFFAILDQNHDGVINAGDIQDASDGTGNDTPVVISGAASNVNLTLPSANAAAAVTTQDFRSTVGAVVNQNYNVSLQINGLLKQPVAVAVASGPNSASPIDIAICGTAGSTCGHGFQFSFGTAGIAPTVGDTYTFNVTYSDSTTGVVTAAVTAVLSNFATVLAPATGTSVSTTPTFTWVDPANASNFTYQLYMNDSVGNQVWQVPGNNSNANGFNSGTTSITWGVDPNDPTNTPSPSTLTLGATYSWSITVQDSNGNSAIQQVQYQP